MNIAFIGLGNMGAPMASNLIKAGHSVTVFDLVESAIQSLESDGATRGESAEAAARGAEVIISMLPAGAHVKGLYLGRNGEPGLLDALDGKPLLIDASTISPEDARTVAAAAAERGISYLDAPVSGGCRRRQGRHPDLYRRRRFGRLRQGQAGARGHGQEHLPRR